MRNERVVEGGNLSDAWAKAFLRAHSARGPLVNLTVGFPVFGENGELFQKNEDEVIKEAVNDTLGQIGKSKVDTVASTIFPDSLWNTNMPREHLYSRYEGIWHRVRRCPPNYNGTYFQRMIAFGWEERKISTEHNPARCKEEDNRLLGEGRFNQIEHVLETFHRGNHRRSALFVAITNPKVDHTHQLQRGFPCLQHVHFVPGEKDDSLTVTGIYSTQLLLEKAYGNYLGLYRIGRFMAKNMGLKLVRVECNASRVNLFGDNDVSKSKLENLKRFLEKNGV